MIFEIKNYTNMQQAMQELCDFLFRNGVSSDRVFDSKLVAYELLGNVLRHAGCEAKFSGEIVDGFIELKIISDSDFCIPEKKPCPEVLAEHGRGLFLVSTVCEGQIFQEDGVVRVRIKL